MKKTITGFIGACSLVALVACGSDGDKPTEVGTLTSSPSATTTATPTASSEAPATSSDMTTEAPSVESGAPAEVPSDPNASSALPRTYAQACADVLRYLDAYQPAIDQSGEEMGMTRESLANDMMASIQAYPEWSSLSADEQAEVTRGFAAATAGSC
ncbi:hypothetical protein R3Q06_00315 [Rhodococcus erythropolis]|uniref:hypothetical protein n=1 Tax=Rhodococcus erythropolis TaxID=1833 RepID=UPI0029494586|nr:hypothetical protein [Rhodococcus erythropolis]MDV6271932.1 hypothetical protein [Rhodococcus erythropolis]